MWSKMELSPVIIIGCRWEPKQIPRGEMAEIWVSWENGCGLMGIYVQPRDLETSSKEAA